MPGRRCAVAGCNNSYNKTKRSEDFVISFHNFPKPIDSVSTAIRDVWIHRCQRLDNFNPNNNSAICSVHFRENDFERDLQSELLGLPLRRLLKRDAVPTQHLGLESCQASEDIEPEISEYFEPEIDISQHIEPKIEIFEYIEPKIEICEHIEPKIEISEVIDPEVSHDSKSYLNELRMQYNNLCKVEQKN